MSGAASDDTGTRQTAENVCPRCAGSGRTPDGTCPVCEGTGVVMEIVGDVSP